jgi:hypothetical protein
MTDDERRYYPTIYKEATGKFDGYEEFGGNGKYEKEIP